METKNSSPRLSTILKIVVALAVILAIWLVVVLVNRSFNEALSPLRQTNQELSTQVANFLHPTPTILPDPVTIIDQVQALARLETIRYTVEKVITAEIDHGVLDPLLGDKLLFVAHGYVIAGIDMSKIDSSDLQLQDGVLNVRLPQAEILVATLDNDKSYVYSRDTGFLTRPDPNLETQARQVAESEIRKAALDDGILNLASTNAQTYLGWFFQSLGYKQVHFVPATP
ncbi:MAG TPA: DUF4230 domain-containing protein [Anaerolineales bacterium]|nr:DUF4230 domain-containing protein [Anaerolineales bacterium]